MAKTISENVRDINAEDSRTATSSEDKIDFVKDISDANRIGGDDVKLSGIRKDMNVIASCGKTLGLVDGVDVNSIKLKCDDCGDKQRQFIPLNWISHVDSQVHLNKNSREAADGWN